MTETKFRLEQGRVYRVAAERAELSWPESIAPYAWTYKRRVLRQGERIRFVGWREGLGSDTVTEAQFETAEGIRGTFGPSSWGSPMPGALEELGWTYHQAEDDEHLWCVHPANEDEQAFLSPEPPTDARFEEETLR